MRLVVAGVTGHSGNCEVGRDPVRVLGVTGAALLGAAFDDRVRSEPLLGRASCRIDDDVRSVVNCHAAVRTMSTMRGFGELAVQEAGRDGAR